MLDARGRCAEILCKDLLQRPRAETLRRCLVQRPRARTPCSDILQKPCGKQRWHMLRLQRQCSITTMHIQLNPWTPGGPTTSPGAETPCLDIVQNLAQILGAEVFGLLQIHGLVQMLFKALVHHMLGAAIRFCCADLVQSSCAELLCRSCAELPVSCCCPPQAEFF